jgi:hypothetical protein
MLMNTWVSKKRKQVPAALQWAWQQRDNGDEVLARSRGQMWLSRDQDAGLRIDQQSRPGGESRKNCQDGKGIDVKFGNK